MILKEQKINIKVWSHNINHFKNIGYEVKMGDEIKINLMDLPRDSTREVKVLCDFCLEKGRETLIKKRYKIALLNLENNSKDCCKNCKNEKGRETLMREHGVSSPMQLESVKNKFKNSCIAKYGVENPSQSDIIKEKKKITNIEKHGTNHYFQTQEFKIKAKKSNLNKYGVSHHTKSDIYKKNYKNSILKKYGVENPAQSIIVKQKYKKTCLDKYGVDSFYKSDVFKRKAHQTMYENGTAPASKQQRYINKLLDGELNYPFKGSYIDIVLINEKICIEYDGSGHDLGVKFGFPKETFINKEKTRQNKIINGGWKLIKIISTKDLLPSDEKIIELINFCKNYLNKEHSWININVDNSEIKRSKFVKKIDLGHLRRV